jgi:hypothetical protein
MSKITGDVIDFHIETSKPGPFHSPLHVLGRQPLISLILYLFFCSPAIHSPQKMTKLCTLCSTQRDILIRCQIDETQKWHFVCPGACWKSVSGGVEDAKGFEGKYPYYKYGGMVCLISLPSQSEGVERKRLAERFLNGC